MPYPLFYTLSNSLLLLIFIVVLVSISLIGLFIFITLTNNGFIHRFNDVNTGVYLAIVSVAVAVVIAFVVTDEWQNFITVQERVFEEANVLLILYETFSLLPESETIKDLIVRYICTIINIEFPAMERFEIPPPNNILRTLQTAIYVYEPSPPLNPMQLILYEKAIDQMNTAMMLRVSRIESSQGVLPNELWWVIIIGYIIIVTMTWFLKGDNYYRLIMNALVSVVYAILIFLVVALDYPFRGDFSIKPGPFIFVLNNIGATCEDNS